MLLLRQMVQAVELSNKTEHLQAELERMDRAVMSHESEERWLREALARSVPRIRPLPASRTTEGRAGKVARDVLEHVHREYHRPLTLSGLARRFRMNASYLSFLFGREVGMPFKAYLTTLRLQQAQRLLRDPHLRISEVAVAVGYSSCERFRAAFRQCTGLSPTEWRNLLESP